MREVDSQVILLQGRGPSEGRLPGCRRGVPCRRIGAQVDSYTRIYIDSMRESINTLRCDFLCLLDTQSKMTRSRLACDKYKRMRIFRSDKMATTCMSCTMLEAL